MADKVHPSASAKPPPSSATRVGESAKIGANATNKSQQVHNVRRPTYRPQPPPPRRSYRRGCCCRVCLWTTAAIVVIAVLAAAVGSVFYLVYRPQRPSFSLSSIHFSKFNLTDTALVSSFNVSVTVRNRNSRIAFVYDQSKIRLFSGEAVVGEGSFAGFNQSTNNATRLSAVVAKSSSGDFEKVKSSLRRNKLPLKIQIETGIRAEIGNAATRKLGIRVSCDGITIPFSPGKTSSFTSNVKCKVGPTIKVF